jgi:translation initiation factor IF-3
MDLVEVSPNAKPPVCKLMDYGKYLYQQKRKHRQSKAQQQTTQMKEIRFRPETDEHDLEIKVNHARKFLEKGNRVQFSVFFRGRQMLHKEQGFEALDKVAEELSDIAKVERPGKFSGKRLTMVLAPEK